ncbi:MAG: dienelactone hydrolase family protein [Bryobacteraceae bacterium]|jgi:carboxymethylenebutenolidase
MKEEAVEIRTVDGTADGFLYGNEESRGPGFLFLADIGGIRPSQREMAARVAGEGYTVLLPNMFYRTHRAPLFEPPMNFADEATRRRFGELKAALPPDAIERDAAGYADFLAAHSGPAKGPIGVMGLCFAGAAALRIAAAAPDRVAAAASFHGGGLFTDAPDSPHLLLPRIRARLYFGHAVEDRSMPAEAIAKLEAALAAWGGRYESEIYEGAYHSWTVPDSPVYNQPQADRAFGKLTELLAQTLR